MKLDIFEYLTKLDQERYRAVILHASPSKGTAVTKFAQRACARVNGKYLDLMGLFIQSRELSEQVDSFNPEKFRALLIEHSSGASLLFVDRVDFILDTWRRGERQDFFRMISDQWDGFREATRSKLLIAMQTSHEIEALKILDSQGQPRVLKLSDFMDIL
jgi:hypothetical protein